MNPTEARLARLRGRTMPRRHDARTISALTANPGCARRALMDAAGVDKQKLAAHVGYPAPFGQSEFAITRGNAFEAQVKDNGAAQLLTLLREVLGLDVTEVRYTDLNDVGGNQDNELRHVYTRQRLTAAAAGTGTLFDHPLLRLRVGGRHAYLEPDLIALRLDGTFHVIEIKSFAVIDGQADPAKVAAAAIQSAVYVRALRDLLRRRPGPGQPRDDPRRAQGLRQPAGRRQPRRPQAARRARPPARPDGEDRGPARRVPDDSPSTSTPTSTSGPSARQATSPPPSRSSPPTTRPSA